jgi:hypothetical protein
MQKIVENALYDTDSAVVLHSVMIHASRPRLGLSDRELRQLMRTPKGTYLLTRASPDGSVFDFDLSDEAGAKGFLAKYASVDVYKQYFPLADG